MAWPHGRLLLLLLLILVAFLLIFQISTDPPILRLYSF